MNIFEFSDYRLFLKAWLAEAKRERRSNLARLSEAAQVHPTFLSHVFAGTKHLSLEQGMGIGQYLGLTNLEFDFLVMLIQQDRAGTPALREYWGEKKKSLEREKNKLSQRFEKKHRELTDEQRTVFYSSWLYAAVWVSTAIGDGQTLEQIAKRFALSKSRAEGIASFLVQTGVCNERGGVFSMGEVHVHVPNESFHVSKHHVNWRMKAMQKMDAREDAELFFTAPMSISKQDFAVLREKLNAAIKEVVSVATKSPAEELLCLNIDFFRPKA